MQLFCTMLAAIFDCKVNIKKKNESYSNDMEAETFKIDDISNMKSVIWSEKHNSMLEVQWKISNGKYGSVALVNTLVPLVSDEILIKSHILATSNNMPMKLKNVRAWFHGNSMINPGWMPENIRMFLAVKSPFNGVHAKGKDLWERENKISLLLSRDIFSIVHDEKDKYQISPSIVTYHSNSRDENKSPTQFFLSKDISKIIKLNDSYRPLFSNYMFMEYIDGYPLDVLLYYLRSDKMFNWLNNDISNRGWKLWLKALLNLVMLVLHSIQSFSSSGYFLYMHCDLNFGNLIIMKEVVDSRDGFTKKKILEDRDDHETNLILISNLEYDSIRIIDFSFTYIFHNKENDEELLDLEDFLKNKGIHKIFGERNFENTCKKILKSALFNDPNYVAIVISEIIKGYSILYNQDKIYNESLGLNINDYNLNFNNISPSLKWNDLSNPFISFLFRLYSSFEDLSEWNEISQEFIENEEPIHRWISKKRKDNQKNVLSTFNQGIEAYMKLCDKIIQFKKISEKSKLIDLNRDTNSAINFNCFSIESYMRSYLFLPYNIVKIGSCIKKQIKNINKLAELIKKSNSYFQFSSLTVSYYFWLLSHKKDKLNNESDSKLISFDFYSELRLYCGIELLDPEKFLMANVQNIDNKFYRTKKIYGQILKNQSDFIFDSIYRYEFPIPIAILFQRTWYRIQELPELIVKHIPFEKILNIIIELFKIIQFSDSNFKKDVFYLEMKILNLCLNLVNNGALNSILESQVFRDSNLANKELCYLIVKPIENTHIIQ